MRRLYVVSLLLLLLIPSVLAVDSSNVKEAWFFNNPDTTTVKGVMGNADLTISSTSQYVNGSSGSGLQTTTGINQDAYITSFPFEQDTAPYQLICSEVTYNIIETGSCNYDAIWSIGNNWELSFDTYCVSPSLRYRTDNTVGSSYHASGTQTGLTANVTYSYCGGMNGTHNILWIDGVEFDNIAYTGTLKSTTGGNFRIGEGSYNGADFDGVFDNFVIMNSVTQEAVDYYMNITQALGYESWSGSPVVALSSGSDGNQMQSLITRDKYGALYANFMNGGFDVTPTWSATNGQTWNPQSDSPDADTNKAPMIFYNNETDEKLAVWQRNGGELKYSLIDAQGNWGTAAAFVNTTACRWANYRISGTIDDNNVVHIVASSDYCNGVTNYDGDWLFYWNYTFGTGWGHTTTANWTTYEIVGLDTDSFDWANEQAVAVDSSGVVYIVMTGRSWDDVLLYKSDTGFAYGDEITVHAGADDQDPRIFIDDSDNIHIAWVGDSSLYYANSSDGGSSWTTQAVVGAGVQETYPALVVTQEGTIVLGYSLTADLSQTLLAYSTDNGDTWTTNIDLWDVSANTYPNPLFTVPNSYGTRNYLYATDDEIPYVVWDDGDNALRFGWTDLQAVPTTPTNITCNGGSCNDTFSGTINIQGSGSTDANGDTITYIIEVANETITQENLTGTWWDAAYTDNTSAIYTTDAQGAPHYFSATGAWSGGTNITQFEQNPCSPNAVPISIDCGGGIYYEDGNWTDADTCSGTAIDEIYNSGTWAFQWDLDDNYFTGDQDTVGAYMTTYVWSDTNQTIRLRHDQDDTAFLEVNGVRQTMNGDTTCEGTAADEETNEFDLRTGWNKIVYAAADSGGGFGIHYRYADTSNNPISLNYTSFAPQGEAGTINVSSYDWTVIGNHTAGNNLSWDSLSYVGETFEGIRVRAVDLSGSTQYSEYYTPGDYLTITSGGASTCTYTSGDWTIVDEHCVVSSDTSIGTNRLNLQGTSSITLSAMITCGSRNVSSNSYINITTGGSFNWTS